MGAAQCTHISQQGEVASMVLWRHVGCLEGPWKGRMDAQRAHAWVPSGLGPACIQGHLLNPPIYTPSVCILSSSSSFTWKNLSCLIWSGDFEYGLNPEENELILYLFDFPRIWGKYDTNFVFHSRNLFCLIYWHPIMIKTYLFQFLIMMIRMKRMMMTLTTLEETLTSLATTATDSSVCSCTVCGEGTKPQKSYNAIILYYSIVL